MLRPVPQMPPQGSRRVLRVCRTSVSGSSGFRTGSSSRTWAYSEHRGKAWTRNRRFKLYDDGRFFHMENDPEEKVAMKPEELKGPAKEAHALLSEALKSIREP